MAKFGVAIGAVLTLGLMAPLPMWACFCLSPATPCEKYQQSDAVFVGVVLRTDPRSLEELGQQLFGVLPLEFANSISTLRRRVLVRVVEPFHGIAEQEVEFITGFTSCDFRFVEKASYLIYASRDEKTHRLTTGACSGTLPIQEASEDLSYLRGVKADEPLANVFGVVTADPSDMDLPLSASKPVTGIPITLTSEQNSWRTITDAAGAYDFSGLPAGSYELAARLPNGAPEQLRRKLDLGPGACSRQAFLTVPVGLISGRLLDADGKPLDGVLVEIEAIPPANQPHPLIRADITDENGQFVHRPLEAGEYVLGVNIGTPPNAKDWYGKRVPFPRSYYPGVTDRANAQVLRIEGDQKMENLEFRLPPRSKEVTVSGRVFWRDGSPAKAGVWLVELDYPSDSCQVDSVETNADGSFSLIGATGRRYAVFAHDEASGQHYHSQAIEVQSSEGKSVTVFLIAKESSEDCEICRRFPRRF